MPARGDRRLTEGWIRFKPRKAAADVDRSVRFMIGHAARYVAFYRNAWTKAGVRPEDIGGVAALVRLPITDRNQLLLGGPAGFLRTGVDAERLRCRHTTGTTGTPVVVYMTPLEARFRSLTLLDSFRRNAGLRVPMTLVDVGPERKDRSTQMVRRAGPITIVRLFRSIPPPEQVKALRGLRPTVIEGRPSMLWALARALEAADIRPPRPRLVVSYAEILYPHVRKLLEHVFGCRVADYYNCEETGNVAWECPEHPGKMHINTATTWVEVVGPDGEPLPYGAVGDIIVTNLYNATMPFVRYTMGDRAALLEPGRCSCGYEGPGMRLIEGRDEDFFVLPDGREVSPRVVYDIVNTALPPAGIGDVLTRSIIAFQIVQEALDRIVVHVVPGPDYNDRLWKELGTHVRRLHPAIRANVALVDSLEPGPGGKFRRVLSRVPSTWTHLRDCRLQ